jgi:D-sedoheptulose 7-phosphate isomerase
MVVKEVKDRIRNIFQESVRTKERFLENNLDVLVEVIRTLGTVINGGNKVLLFGNGGSAADAQHLAAEFVNRYLIDRPPLAALALTTDTSVLTAIANDFDWSEVFSKQIRALGKAGDAAVGISTSGRSSNVVKGLEAARDLGLVTIGIGGPRDAPMHRLCRHYLTVDSAITPRIQETHLLVGHTIVELLDEMLFGGRASV